MEVNEKWENRPRTFGVCVRFNGQNFVYDDENFGIDEPEKGFYRVYYMNVGVVTEKDVQMTTIAKFPVALSSYEYLMLKRGDKILYRAKR